MGDPLWSDRFQPVFAKAIPLLTQLLRRELIKRLLAKQLIDLNDYDHLVEALKRKPWAETSARELYGILRQKPEPSFATFCDVLLKVGGEDLHCLLKYGEVPLVVNVETDNEELYKSHSKALITIMKVYVEQATGIPNRRVRSTTKFMNPMTPKGLVSVERSAEIRISFPTVDHRCFRLYEEKVVKVITDLMETRNFVLEIWYMHDIIHRLHPDDRSQGIYDDATSSVTVNRSHDHSGDHSQEIYDEALKHGFVTVNRSRVIVAGQDGAGKSCFVDSLLNRSFKKDRESTEGAVVEMTYTATNGWVATERGDHLDSLIAEGVYRMNQQPSSSSEESKDLDAQETEPDKSERYYGSSAALGTAKPTPAAEQLKAVGIEAKTLTPNQKRLASSFLADKPSEEDLTKKIVSIRDIWDLGGQEIYLATHSALIPDSKEFGLCMYMIVMDISKSLSAKAESFCRSIDEDGRRKMQAIDLSWIRTNGDFPLYWFASITAAHEETPSGDHQLGQDEDVAYPPVFAIGSHRDVLDNDKEGFPDSASVKDWLKKQGQLFKQLLKDSDFKQHIVVPKKRGIGKDDDDFREMAHFFKRMFLIDNSVSGSEFFCKGVREIREKVDRMTTTYWNRMKKKKKQPLYWVYLEILLFRWREFMGTVVANVEEIVTLAQHPKICNISDRDEVLLALQYLANVGAVLFYPEVDGLDDVVFTRPMSVIKTLSAFVTAETVPYMKPEWAKLKKDGKMSNKLMTYRLGQMRKSDSASSLTEKNEKQIDDDNKKMVKLLEILDVITPVKGSSPTEFYVPSMLKKPLLSSPSTTYWECLTLGDLKPRCCTLPAPLIVIPIKLKFVPECLFFRLITRFLKVYPNKPRLSRHQCIFLAQDEDSPVQVEVELLYHNRGKWIALTIRFINEKDRKRMSKWFLASIKTELRKQMKNVCHQGTKGFKYRICCQTKKAVCTDEEICIDLNSLPVIFDGDCDSYSTFDTYIYNPFGEPLANEQVDFQMECWFEHQLSDVSSPAPQDDLPEKINPSLIRAVATVVEEKWPRLAVNLEQRAGATLLYKERSDDNFLRAMMVVEDWETERGREATVDALLKACEKSGIHRDRIKAAYKKEL